MVVAGCVALVGMPVGVYAAANAIVISDPVHANHKARVDTGKLRVGDGSGPMTVDGTVQVKGTTQIRNGSSPLTVDGTVRPAPPQTPWNQINDIAVTQANTRQPLYTGLGPTKLNLTSMTFAAEGAAGTVRLFLIVYVSDSAAGDCDALTGASFGAAERLVVIVPTGQTLNLVYPTPLQYSAYAAAGKRYCVDLESSNGPATYTVHFSGSGFLA